MLLLATTTAGLGVDCVDHPDFLDSQKTRTWENKCDGEAPQCLSSCAQALDAGMAVCSGSVWSCAQGIRADLCCDPVNAPDQCETFTTDCSRGNPCPGGYTCVKSRLHPVPSEEGGVCRLGDLAIPEEMANCTPTGEVDPRVLPSLGATPVKVHGVVAASVVCDDRKCTPDNACCQSCSGAYTIDLYDPVNAAHTLLPIRTETVACAGTNCGYSCFPLQPGRRYTVWGLYLPDADRVDVGTLYYSGSCAD
ncbi:MAG: hypothetical protein KC635_07015 [Myxococcales bacterium]|nr:hypothetical protein [Myxococcales bacterium]